MSTVVSQITGVSMVCSNICSGADQRKQSSASLAFVRGIYRSQRASNAEKFQFDDIMSTADVAYQKHVIGAICKMIQSHAIQLKFRERHDEASAERVNHHY